jgi:hypothetical protein
MQTDLGNKGGEAPQSELQQVKCILHIGKETGSEKVKLFTVQMLENCREKSLVYKFREKSEYATIIIPESADNNTGYHSSCYRKFTAVSAKELKAALEIGKVPLTNNLFHLLALILIKQNQVIIEIFF